MLGSSNLCEQRCESGGDTLSIFNSVPQCACACRFTFTTADEERIIRGTKAGFHARVLAIIVRTFCPFFNVTNMFYDRSIEV